MMDWPAARQPSVPRRCDDFTHLRYPSGKRRFPKIPSFSFSARSAGVVSACRGAAMGHHDLFEVNGVHVSRFEDLRLITGAGTYASDWNLPGQLHGFFLRSDRAHANIVSLDATRARKHPGV